jgi:hypothetical protein
LAALPTPRSRLYVMKTGHTAACVHWKPEETLARSAPGASSRTLDRWLST